MNYLYFHPKVDVNTILFTFVYETTGWQGVDLVVDPIGAAYWDRNIHCLKQGGGLVLFGLLRGAMVEVNLGMVLTKQLAIVATVLRHRSLEDKTAVVRRFQDRWLPLLASGILRPVIDSVFALPLAAEAHRYMQANKNIGKVMLEVSSE